MTERWRPPTTAETREVLQTARTIAVVGVSADPTRPSHGVAAYLVEHTDYEVWLVNPNLTTLFGRTVYPSLADLPSAPDIIDVFRRASELPGITDEAIAAHARVLWFQLGLYDETLATAATSAGLTVVMDRCLKVEHRALVGPAD
jgi:Predicted CoA-binding protein